MNDRRVGVIDANEDVGTKVRSGRDIDFGKNRRLPVGHGWRALSCVLTNEREAQRPKPERQTRIRRRSREEVDEPGSGAQKCNLNPIDHSPYRLIGQPKVRSQRADRTDMARSPRTARLDRLLARAPRARGTSAPAPTP